MIVAAVGMADMITFVIVGAILVALAVVGLVYFNRRSMFKVQQVIADEVKGYLGVILEDHRDRAAEIVTQGVQVQLDQVKDELRLALAEVVRAEAAQLVAEDAQDVAEDATQAQNRLSIPHEP